MWYETIDATRLSDGALVCILRVLGESVEKSVLMLFSQRDLRDIRQNCIPPVLDMFQDEEATELWYLVVPFLRPMDDPPFETIDDVVSFTDQVLEVRCLL